MDEVVSRLRPDLAHHRLRDLLAFVLADVQLRARPLILRHRLLEGAQLVLRRAQRLDRLVGVVVVLVTPPAHAVQRALLRAALLHRHDLLDLVLLLLVVLLRIVGGLLRGRAGAGAGARSRAGAPAGAGPGAAARGARRRCGRGGRGCGARRWLFLVAGSRAFGPAAPIEVAGLAGLPALAGAPLAHPARGHRRGVCAVLSFLSCYAPR